MILFFLSLVIKSSLLLLMARLATWALRKGSPSSRHAIWVAAFLAVLALPAFEKLMPAATVVRLAAAPPVAKAEPILSKAPELDEHDISLAESLPSIAIPVAPAKPDPPKPKSPDFQVFIWIWVAGTGLVLLQYGGALVALARTRSRRPPILQPSILEELSKRVGVQRDWELRLSESSRLPAAMTWGVMNPIVLLPHDAGSWTQGRLEAVLLHELAHVRRRDALSQALSCFVCALYWFNPAVWLSARAMRSEAELAADELVLNSGIKASSYAEELLRIAAELGTRRQPFANIGVPIMKLSKIESRVRAILRTSNRPLKSSQGELKFALALGVLILLPISSLRAGVLPNPLPTTLSPDAVVVNSGQKSKAKPKSHKKVVHHAKKSSRQSATAKRRAEREVALAKVRLMKDQQRAELLQARAVLEQARADKDRRLDEFKLSESRTKAVEEKLQMLERQIQELLKEKEELLRLKQGGNASADQEKDERLYRLLRDKADAAAQVNLAKARLDQVERLVQAGNAPVAQTEEAKINLQNAVEKLKLVEEQLAKIKK